MICRNLLTDLFWFSPRDMARIEEPFRHLLLPRARGEIRGAIEIKFDGTRYRNDIYVPEDSHDQASAYQKAVVEALNDIYARLPLLDRQRQRYHWHEFDAP